LRDVMARYRMRENTAPTLASAFSMDGRLSGRTRASEAVLYVDRIRGGS